jgi:mannosyltransferase
VTSGGRDRFVTGPRPWYGALALAACGVSVWLMLHGLGNRPLWFDETVSVEAAKLPIADLVRYVAGHESNMALYHALLHPWEGVLGAGEAASRVPSVVFALATLPAIGLLARRLFDEATAALAVVLVAVDVPFVAHAREARSYSLALLLATVAALCLAVAVEDDRRRAWVLYGVVGALAIYAHLFAALAIFGQIISLVARRDAAWRRAGVAVLVAGLLLAPVLVAVAIGGQGGQIDWLEQPHVRQLPGLLLWLAGPRPVAALFAIGIVLALAAAYRDLARDGAGTDASWRWVLLLGWLAAPPMVAFLISYEKPVYLYRYFLFSLPALALLVAAGLMRVGRRIALVAVLAAAALSLQSIAAHGADAPLRHDDWRAAAAYVRNHARPADAIAFDPPELRTAYAHYAGSRSPYLLYPQRWSLVDDADVEPPRGFAGTPSRFSRIWLVTWWLPSGAVAAALPPPFTLTESHDFAGNVRVRLYVRGTSS